MKTVVIINKTARGLNLPLDCVVRGHSEDGSPLLGRMLAPGPNTVVGELLEQVLVGYKRPGRSDVRGNKTVASWFSEELGWLVNSGEGKAKGLAESLGSMSAADAKKQIEACTEPRVLERWGANENRSTVSAAISRRLVALRSEDDSAQGGDDSDDDEEA